MKCTYLLLAVLFFLPSVSFAESDVNSIQALAEAGDSQAMFDLGQMYHDGDQVTQNDELALKLLRKAADNGNNDALFKLGCLYYDGEGVSQDYGEAIKWYTKAADNGLATAMYNLASMYYNGIGVDKDYAVSFMWATLALSRGDKNSIGLSNELNDKMTGAQLAKGTQLTREWLKRHPSLR